MEKLVELVADSLAIFITIAFSFSALLAVVAMGYLVVVLCVRGYKIARVGRTEETGGKTRDDENGQA